jgi:hypothetical protein
MRIFVWSVVGLASGFAIWAGGLSSSREADTARFVAQGWGQYAEVIVSNKIGALWHAALLTFCVAGFLWLFLLSNRQKTIVRTLAQWGLVLLVAGDAWLLSRHYVKTMPLSSLDENPVISLLKKDMPEHRVALVSQDGFYNWWLTYAFPYHGIQAVNTTQMPRMPDDYKNFLGAVGRNPIRYWQLASVGYVLAPAEVWGQLQKEPRLKDLFDLVWSYNVAPAEAGVEVIPALTTGTPPARHVVLRFKAPAPRYALIAGWEGCDDQETLKRLAAPEYRLSERVLLPPETAATLPPLHGAGMVGKVESLMCRPGFFHLKTTCEQPSILRLAEKHDPNWKAMVDGKPATLLRADYIFQALYLPPGVHEVVLKYAPAHGALYIQLSGMLVCLLVVLGMILRNVVLKRRGER